MDFSLDEDLLSIQHEARRLADKFDDDYWREHDENHEFPWAYYNAFAEQGWIGIIVPEKYGGSGLGGTTTSGDTGVKGHVGTDTLGVDGDAQFDGSVSVAGDSKVAGGLSVDGLVGFGGVAEPQAALRKISKPYP